MEYFITEIDIKKVRHLENLIIKLSDTERKHLILTGKNGSGKTSVLEVLKKYLRSFDNAFLRRISSNYVSYIEEQNRTMSLSINQENFDNSNDLTYKTKVALAEANQNGDFILVYFSVQRLNKPVIPQGANKYESMENPPPINEKINEKLIQRLVNLHFKKLNAINEKDEETVIQIENWFSNFTQMLQSIFQDNSLQLKFDIDKMNFNILTKDKKFDFTTLSDGYSAFLNIVTEIILRMESKAPKVYDIQGIVLIDEIETHLHIDLQKKIMPLLTTFFPKIQFIVTTHSPFVLSSISNAVIYDLEKKLRVEDLSSYAVDGIIEGYFDADKYSQEIKTKMARYEILAQKEEKTLEEREEFVDLRSELKDISAKLAPELAYAFKTLELSRLSKISG